MLVFIVLIASVKVISSYKSKDASLSEASISASSFPSFILFNRLDTISIKSFGRFLISFSFKLLI